ncbi:MAG TPA: HIT domain-containing protein [Acidimicrobiales bacterium]|nr:HIT domain-containing protein [Acidimicrobiales bacterium]
MTIERLWAGWRMAYVEGPADARVAAGEGSLFERILTSGLPDREAYVLWRGATCAALLNAYPYNNGHLMVLPRRAVAGLDGLSEAEHAELWRGVRMGVAAVTAAYHPQGVNVGLNLGPASGAGVPDHLHVHVVPRWSGDTNFMTAVAETRVVPEALDATWAKLRAAWPVDEPGS